MSDHRARTLATRRYLDRVRRIQAANLIGLWPGNEKSGTVAYDKSGNARNGSYSGVTLEHGRGPDGQVIPLYDGLVDYTNVFGAGLAGAFNGGIGALACWFQVASAGVWTDGAQRMALTFYQQAGASFNLELYKPTSANSLITYIKTGGVGKAVTKSSYAPTGLIPCVVNWADGAHGDILQTFLSGVSVGTATGFGNWDGGVITAANIGKYLTDAFWSGWIGPVALWAGVNLNARDIAVWSVP
jgi:hypothetical protein